MDLRHLVRRMQLVGIGLMWTNVVPKLSPEVTHGLDRMSRILGGKAQLTLLKRPNLQRYVDRRSAATLVDKSPGDGASGRRGADGCQWDGLLPLWRRADMEPPSF